MSMRSNERWNFIERCRKDAREQIVEQPQMTAFLKKTYTVVLDELEKLIREGIDLSDKDIISNLRELELDLKRIPQQRIHAFSVSTVLEEFEDYEERFYLLLSIPKQNAETSFSCGWVTGRFDAFSNELHYLNDSIDLLEGVESYLEDGESLHCKLTEKIVNWGKEKEQLTERFASKLHPYLLVCNNLIDNGSDMIRAMLADAVENLAHDLISENLLNEAGLVWHLVIQLLSQENIRISHRD